MINDMTGKSELHQETMKKIYEASWKFDRGKNGDFLKNLDNKQLPKDLFRQMVGSGMNLKLSANELDSVIGLFENNGMVDGCEFTLIFYRLRYEHRSKVFTERVRTQRRIVERQKAAEEKILQELEVKTHISLLSEFEQADLDSAMKKIINAAVKYDRLMPGAVQLDAFDCEFMIPSVFREQMKLVFNVSLSMAELSAFIINFNRDNDHGERVNCASFLVSFFRAGFQERTNRLHAVWKEKTRVMEEKKRKELADLREQEMKNSLKVNSVFTEAEKASAIVKLRTAARLYDKTTPGAMSMRAFEVKEMAPHVFKEQLKRIFNLNVTPAEMGALVTVFDIDGDGVITCEEFSKVFINMGFKEREKELKESRARQKRDDERRKKAKEDKQAALENKQALKVSYNYTEEEQQSAMEKLLEAAWKYDKLMPGAPCLDAFDRQYMEPHILQEQLRKAFWMKVTPQELGAIVHMFDTNGSGTIECEKFLKSFSKAGFDERQRRKSQWRIHQKQLNDRRAKLQRQIQLEKDNKIAFNDVDHSYSEADFQSGFGKLTTGAMKYSKSGPGAVGLDAFEANSMPPHVFKEQLKLVFNINVTLPELWAIVDYFDTQKTGEVPCKHFLTQFLRTGIEERIRIRQGWRKEELLKIEKDKIEAEAKEAEKEKKAWEEVDFDFLEPDFDSMMVLFVNLCFNFDRRQLGPAGLSAFEVDSLNPAEFREMLKRTFNIKVTPRELGAMVTYFDTKSKKSVDCAMFLNAIVQTRVSCEEFRGRKNESKKKEELRLHLKEQYQHRVARSMSVDARPWRHNAVLPTESQFAKTATKQVGAAPPATPIEKYRLRLAVARQTGRLDLACKAVWGEDDDADGTVAPDDEDEDGQQEEGEEEGEEKGETAGLEGEEEIVPEEDGEREREEGDEDAADGSEGGDGAKKKKDGDDSGVSKMDFRLSIIPSEVLKLTEITELWLDNNLLSTIPSAFGELRHLNTLSLANNQLEVLPPEVCNLVNMKTLIVRGNKLTSLPNLLLQMRRLMYLDCAHNQISDFPEVLTDMPQLIHLDFCYNRIPSLPSTLQQLQNLAYLNLEGNGIDEKMPPVLLRMPWLEVSGVPLTAAGMDERGSRPYLVTPNEELELTNLLKGRAAASLTTKLRRKRKNAVKKTAY